MSFRTNKLYNLYPDNSSIKKIYIQLILLKQFDLEESLRTIKSYDLCPNNSMIKWMYIQLII